MSPEDWKKTAVASKGTILDAMQVLDREGLQIVLVVDSNQVLVGTVTDGDVRRGLLRGVSLEAEVSEIMNRSPSVADVHTGREELVRRMRERGLRHLPVVNESGKVVRLEFLDRVRVTHKRENHVLLMAGGMGTRLRPLTQDCPKPLLNVGGRPILETILVQLIEYGFARFFISVHYKAEMIREHFGDGSKWGVRIDYIEESDQMGTGGALALLPEVSSAPTLVMNGDILTKVNFDQLLQFHREQSAVATMAIGEYDFRVPYGVVRMDGERLTSIDEKPLQKFFINAGIYVLDPQVIAELPKGEKLDMPDVFRLVIANNSRVAAFPIREYWLDIGKPDDFERANFDFNDVFIGRAERDEE